MVRRGFLWNEAKADVLNNFVIAVYEIIAG